MPPEAQKNLIQSLIKEITVYDDKLEINLFTSSLPSLGIPGQQKRLTPKSKALTASLGGSRNRKEWLPRMDSNHDNKIQNLVSYH